LNQPIFSREEAFRVRIEEMVRVCVRLLRNKTVGRLDIMGMTNSGNCMEITVKNKRMWDYGEERHGYG
jgi:hypothetical protein